MDPLRELMHLFGALQRLRRSPSTSDPAELGRLGARVGVLDAPWVS